MTRRKKSADNPEPLFRKVLIENSVSDTWKEAIREWEMTGYYNVTDKYKSCIDSAQQIKNLTVITNKFNFKQLEICNRCVELYFDTSESRKIETAVRRIMTKRSYIINKEGLLYLLVNEAISFNELLCYEALMKKRNYPEIIKFKERTNEKLINLTAYKNKQAIDDINCILAWVKEQHPKYDLKPVATIWKDIISGGIVDMDALNSIIEDNKITRRFYTKSEIKEARQLLVKYMDDDNIDSHVYSAYLDSIPETIVEDSIGFETERELPTREEYLRRNNFEKSDPNKICIRGEILDLSCLEEGIVEDYVEEDDEEELTIKDAELQRYEKFEITQNHQQDKSHESETSPEESEDLFSKQDIEMQLAKIREYNIKDIYFDVGMLVMQFMTAQKYGYKFIDYNGGLNDVDNILAFLDIPEITKFFKEKNRKFISLAQLTRIFDDEHLGYLLSGLIIKIMPKDKPIAIMRINEYLSYVDKVLILDEMAEEHYRYKVEDLNVIR